MGGGPAGCKLAVRGGGVVGSVRSEAAAPGTVAIGYQARKTKCYQTDHCGQRAHWDPGLGRTEGKSLSGNAGELY